MEYQFIRFERRESLGLLTLNRPEKLNAISVKFAEELSDFFTGLGDDLKTRVVIVRSEGRAFCAGADINEIIRVNAEEENDYGPGKMQSSYSFGKPFQRIVLKMRRSPQPLIAAIRGPAIGAGFSISMACDIRVAGDSARFSAGFIRIGLSGGDMGSSYFLPRMIGFSRAAELLYTGKFMDATTAERIGFVSRVVPDAQVDTAAMEIAQEMLQNSPFGLRMTKELLNMNIDASSLENAVQLENRTQTILGLTEDSKEAIQAAREKRVPRYRDR